MRKRCKMETRKEVNYNAMLEAQVLAILADNGFMPADDYDPEPHEVAASMGMTKEELEFELEKGMKCIEEGRLTTHEEICEMFGYKP